MAEQASGFVTAKIETGPKFPFIKVAHGRAVKGDFIHCEILECEIIEEEKEDEKTGNKYTKTEARYTVRLQNEYKLSDTEKLDGSIVPQEVVPGEMYFMSTTGSFRPRGIRKQLESTMKEFNLSFPVEAMITFDGKEMWEGKKFNNFVVQVKVPEPASTEGDPANLEGPGF